MHSCPRFPLVVRFYTADVGFWTEMDGEVLVLDSFTPCPLIGIVHNWSLLFLFTPYMCGGVCCFNKALHNPDITPTHCGYERAINLQREAVITDLGLPVLLADLVRSIYKFVQCRWFRQNWKQKISMTTSSSFFWVLITVVLYAVRCVPFIVNCTPTYCTVVTNTQPTTMLFSFVHWQPISNKWSALMQHTLTSDIMC